MRALEIRRVTKRYDDHTGSRLVLDRVDLEVERGEIVAVVGRSGSGKTTLLTLASGFEPPDEGEVIRQGSEPAADVPPWCEVALLPQSLGLLAELTVAENIALPLRLAALPNADDPGALMEDLGIDRYADRYPDEISLGEQQRTSLARALVVRPRVLLADEPVSHQNHDWADIMLGLIDAVAASGTACLLATHDEVAVARSDRVLELHDGRLRRRDRDA